jgi:hypothetical protein
MTCCLTWSCITSSLIELDANSRVGISKRMRVRVKRRDFSVQSKFTLAVVYAEVSRRILAIVPQDGPASHPGCASRAIGLPGTKFV